VIQSTRIYGSLLLNNPFQPTGALFLRVAPS